MPVTALAPEEIADVVAAAVSAPSVMNTQPWRFRAHDDVIDLLADPRREVGVLDPSGRELLISCGAALMNLRLAVALHSREPVVRLLPHSSDPLLLARVRIAGQRRPTPQELRLADAIPLRCSSREPFRSDPVPVELLDELAEAAATEGARLDVATGWQRKNVAELVHQADLEQRGDPGVVGSVDRWTRNRTDLRSGIPVGSLGPRANDPNSLVRDFALGRQVEGRPRADFEDGALLAVLLTGRDAPADRLRAGQALERVLLTATAAGLSTSLLTQPTEIPDLRQLLRDPTGGLGSAQAVLRLGYGPAPQVTPRRPVGDVLEIVDEGMSP